MNEGKEKGHMKEKWERIELAATYQHWKRNKELKCQQENDSKKIGLRESESKRFRWDNKDRWILRVQKKMRELMEIFKN